MSIKKRRIALCGNVNTEEVFAKRLIKEGAEVDGFLLSPNDAFAALCHHATLLCHEPEEYRTTTLMDTLKYRGYDAIVLGPEAMARALSTELRKRGIPHVGATDSQLDYESDKTLIFDVFPPETGILPQSLVLTSTDSQEINDALTIYGERVVLKFVGDYNTHYSGSPVGRVRIGYDTLPSLEDRVAFVRRSIEVSGRCLIQELVQGHEFSSNYAVDVNGGLFRFGENVCYKHRYAGNVGPLCDGTGSVTFGNTLPFLTEKDVAFMEDRIIRPFVVALQARTGTPVCALLNIDAMKTLDGKIVLFEVNVREAGGHTMANILPGLQTPLSQILIAAQQGRLAEISPIFDSQCSLVVSAYPPYYPQGAATDDGLLVETVTTDIPPDVDCYTGWVDLLGRTKTARRMRLQNSPTLLFQHSASTLDAARERLYTVMAELLPPSLEYRKDIGLLL